MNFSDYLAQLAPINQQASGKGVKLQFKATVYIDQQNGQISKNYG